MGLIDFIKNQFLDTLDWRETEDGVLAYRFPMRDAEIQMGATLTVHESQFVLFVNEGRLADQFGPGLYTLTPQTLPLLSHLKGWDPSFSSSFKSDLYFLSTRLQRDQKWEIPSSLTIRDKELGPIPLRAQGVYSYKIDDPKLFFTKMIEVGEGFTTKALEDHLYQTVAAVLTKLFGEADPNFIEVAANPAKFSSKISVALAPEFTKSGLALDSLFVQNIFLPQEVRTRFQEKTVGNFVWDLESYAQFQPASGLSMTPTTPLSASSEVLGDSSVENPLTTLEKLHELQKKGVITTAEFEVKKAELLKKIS